MECVLEVLQLAGAHNGSGDTGLSEHPGERNLGTVHTALSGNLRNAIHNIEVRIFVIETVRIFVGLRAKGAACTVATLAAAGEKAPCERAPRDEPDFLGAAERDHLTLLLAID